MKIGDEVKVEKRGGAIPFISGRGTKTWKDLDVEGIERQLREQKSVVASEKEKKKVVKTTTKKTKSDNAENNTTEIINNWYNNIGKSLIDVVPSVSDPQTGTKSFLCPCFRKTHLEHISNSTGTTSASLFCVSELCKDKVIATLSFFTGKTGLDIPTMSSATLEALYDYNLITNKPSSLMRLVADPRYRALLYRLGGVELNVDGGIGHDVNINAKNAKIDTQWDYINLPNPNDLDINLPVVNHVKSGGWQRKKIENILLAIDRSHQTPIPSGSNTTPSQSNHDEKVSQILLAYGLTTTHINALFELVQTEMGSSLMASTQKAASSSPKTRSLGAILPSLLQNVSPDMLTSYTSLKQATAKDLTQKLISAKADLIVLAGYDVPCLSHVKDVYY